MPELTKKEYLKGKVNVLFYQRINGERYVQFYEEKSNNISGYFDKKVV